MEGVSPNVTGMPSAPAVIAAKKGIGARALRSILSASCSTSCMGSEPDDIADVTINRAVVEGRSPRHPQKQDKEAA